MENFALFFHTPDYDGILAKVKRAFPKANLQSFEEDETRGVLVELKGGLFSRKEKVKINYRERLNASYTLNTIECPVTTQLTGMYRFVAALPAANVQLQSLLLKKIETINAELVFIIEPKLTDTLKKLLFEITQAYDAFIFTQPGTIISKSPVQQFLDKHFNLILDTAGNAGNGLVNIEISSQYFDDQQPASPEQVERKKRSEALLIQNGIMTNTHLPYTPSLETVKVRSKQAVIERVYALTLIAAKGEGVPMEQLEKVKSDLAINGLSPYENQIYTKAVLSDQEKINAIWRYESLYVLLWALGFIETLPHPSGICDVPKIVELVIRQSRPAFEHSATLRSNLEILDELDKVYRMHWACVQARLTGKQPGGELMGSVIYERHYALNWLTCYQDQDWDDVSTDT